MIDRNSMLYWWPLVVDLGIPMPETEIVELGLSMKDIYGLVDGEKESALKMDARIPAIEDAVVKVRLPAFLRTDFTSGKHEWKSTCYYDATRPIRHHISELVNYSSICDLTMNAIVVRQYIPMQSAFTAFSGAMPVNPERRYFVRDGAVECHHPYWIADALLEQWAETGQSRLPDDWLELLHCVNTETDEEVAILIEYATTIAEAMEYEHNYWSVDFCKAADGRWIFIDMATGERSWHQDGCPHKKDE